MFDAHATLTLWLPVLRCYSATEQKDPQSHMPCFFKQSLDDLEKSQQPGSIQVPYVTVAKYANRHAKATVASAILHCDDQWGLSLATFATNPSVSLESGGKLFKAWASSMSSIKSSIPFVSDDVGFKYVCRASSVTHV